MNHIVNHWFERGGQRLTVVLNRGPKWTRVLDCGNLHAYKIPTCDLDKYSREVNVTPRKLASRLDKRRKASKRLGIFGKQFTDKAVREAIKLLRTEESQQKGRCANSDPVE